MVKHGRRSFESGFPGGPDALHRRLWSLYVEGFTQEEMGREIQCCPQTVRRNLKAALEKYKPKNYVRIERPVKPRRKLAEAYPEGEEAFYEKILGLREEGKEIRVIAETFQCPLTTMAEYLRYAREAREKRRETLCGAELQNALATMMSGPLVSKV